MWLLTLQHRLLHTIHILLEILPYPLYFQSSATDNLYSNQYFAFQQTPIQFADIERSTDESSRLNCVYFHEIEIILVTLLGRIYYIEMKKQRKVIYGIA